MLMTDHNICKYDESHPVAASDRRFMWQWIADLPRAVRCTVLCALRCPLALGATSRGGGRSYRHPPFCIINLTNKYAAGKS